MKKRRTQAEVTIALAEVKKLVDRGMPATQACAQIGLAENSWYSRAKRFKRTVEKPRRKYRKSPRPVLLQVPAPLPTPAAAMRLIALVGSPDDVLAAIRSLA